jgi:hypothetical protein
MPGVRCLVPAVVLQPLFCHRRCFGHFSSHQPLGYQPLDYQPLGYQPLGYQPLGYQPLGYQPSARQSVEGGSRSNRGGIAVAGLLDFLAKTISEVGIRENQ